MSKIDIAHEGCERLGLRPTNLHNNSFRSDCPVHGKNDREDTRNTTWGYKKDTDTVVWCCHSQKCHKDSAREGYEAVGLGPKQRESSYVAGEQRQKQRETGAELKDSGYPFERYHPEHHPDHTIYWWRDPDGVRYLGVVRYYTISNGKRVKRFFQVHCRAGLIYKKKNKASWGFDKKYPYRVDDLLRMAEEHEAAKKQFVVHVVEGEKAVDRFWSIDLPATTFGAAKEAGSVYWEVFRDCRNILFLVWGDADKPGRAAAETAANCLAKHHTLVMLVTPSPGDKVGDYIVQENDGMDDIVTAVGFDPLRPYADKHGRMAIYNPAKMKMVVTPEGNAEELAIADEESAPEEKPAFTNQRALQDFFIETHGENYFYEADEKQWYHYNEETGYRDKVSPGSIRRILINEVRSRNPGRGGRTWITGVYADLQDLLEKNDVPWKTELATLPLPGNRSISLVLTKKKVRQRKKNTSRTQHR